jgi:hypothetical protein
MGTNFRLLGPTGFENSDTKGTLGGNKGTKVYGTMDCSVAARYLAKGSYQKNRVFFADEGTAIATGYRPCNSCMKERWKAWKAGGTTGTADYPWLILPKK